MNVEKLVNLTLEETVVEAHHERVLFVSADDKKIQQISVLQILILKQIKINMAN